MTNSRLEKLEGRQNELLNNFGYGPFQDGLNQIEIEKIEKQIAAMPSPSAQTVTDAPHLDHRYLLCEAHELCRFYSADDKKLYTSGVIADCIATIENLQERNDRLTASLAAASDREARLEAALRPFAEYQLSIVGFAGAICRTDLKDCDWVAGFSGPTQPEFKHFSAARSALSQTEALDLRIAKLRASR